MATLSDLITTLKGKMLPLTGGTLTGKLTAPSVSITNDNAKVNGKNIVRSVNGTVAGEDGDVVIEIATPVVQTVWSSTQRDAVLPAGTALTIPSYEMNTSKLVASPLQMPRKVAAPDTLTLIWLAASGTRLPSLSVLKLKHR